MSITLSELHEAKEKHSVLILNSQRANILYIGETRVFLELITESKESIMETSRCMKQILKIADIEKRPPSIDSFLEEYQCLELWQVREQFKHFLDDTYEEIELAGMKITASDMEVIDPIMFRTECNNWSDHVYTEHVGDYYLTSDYEQAECDMEADEYEANKAE